MSAQRRLRIVFLPYQAAMWDSMASIWRAASQDPQAEVRVVPVPYDELDSAHHVSRHCAGEALPPEVPTVSAADFSFETFPPDIVYIHNVYDANNLITRVDPAFRTDALRALGCVVVYVPYYIVGGVLPEPQRALPGYDNVDVIALQTPAHTQQLPQRHRAKVIALGTPKADYAVEAVRVAAERHGTEDETGRARPRITVLLTTSITEVLEHNQSALARTWEVIEFAASHDDVELIWRPHPLLASTLVAMRPHLASFFAEMLRTASKLPRVRIDLAKDYAPSLARADCYIGLSPTSLALLAGITGMPILMLHGGASGVLTESFAPTQAPSFGDFAETLPWVCAETNGDVTLATFLDHVASADHDRARQIHEFARITGPLDGRVGSTIHAALAAGARHSTSLR